MEKITGENNQPTFKLEPSESVVVYDSRTGISRGVVRTNPKNINEDACETVRKAFEMAGLQIRE